MKKKIVCTCCGEEIEEETDEAYISYDEQRKTLQIFCNAECIANWYGERKDWEELLEETKIMRK
jgi:hypothetical protein